MEKRHIPIKSQNKRDHRAAHHTGRKPLPFIELAILDIQPERFHNALPQIFGKQLFHPQDNHRGNIADDIINFSGNLVLRFVEQAVLFHECLIEFNDDADSDERHKHYDESRIEIEKCQSNQGTKKAHHGLNKLKAIFGEVIECLRPLLDLIDSIARMMLGVPFERQSDGTIQKILLVVGADKKTIGRFQYARRAMKRPENNGLEDKQAEKNKKSIQVGEGYPLLLNRVQYLRHDERFREADGIGDDEQKEK